MNTRGMVVGIVAGLTVFTACAQATQPGAPTPAASVPAASAPASSAAAPAGNDIDAFMGKVVAAQQGVKTYTIDMTMQTALAGKPTKMVMKGVVDQTDRSNINMSMDIEMGGMGTMKTLKVDGDMYLKLGASQKQWMKVPKSQMAQYEGTTDSADITAGMEKAKGAMKKVELVGDETLDGVAVHHYRITLDAAGLSKMTGSDATITGDTFDYDVWLDDASLLRKVSMDVKADSDGEELPMKVEGVMGNYDEPVSIKAPAPGDVVEMGG